MCCDDIPRARIGAKKKWFYGWSHDKCIQFLTVLKPPDRLDLYIANIVQWSVVHEKQIWLALVLLINPYAHIDFIHRALVVVCIHVCCCWNIVHHLVNVTWSPWASVAVRIMNVILLMCGLLFPLFSLDAKHKDPSYWDGHRSLPNFQMQ